MRKFRKNEIKCNKNILFDFLNVLKIFSNKQKNMKMEYCFILY